MKPTFIVAVAGIALLAGGVLVASEFGNDRGTVAVAQNAPADRASPIQSGEPISAALKTVTLKVGNMYCASCPVMVRRTLERVDGVRQVRVSFRSKTATVAYDPARCDEAKLTAATTEMGYPSKVVR